MFKHGIEKIGALSRLAERRYHSNLIKGVYNGWKVSKSIKRKKSSDNESLDEKKNVFIYKQIWKKWRRSIKHVRFEAQRKVVFY